MTPKSEEAVESETLPKGGKLVALKVEPASVDLKNRFAYAQVLVTGQLESGDLVDVTRMAEVQATNGLAVSTKAGLVRPVLDGRGVLNIAVHGLKAEIPLIVSGVNDRPRVDFVHDVNPVLSRLGCNQGTCHGSAQGKNGFKLSLRGYDPIFDVRALTDDQAARRANVVSPDDSLMLLKPTAAVPHVGGQVMVPGEPYYETIRAWIADGAVLKANTPRVAKIELSPSNPIIQQVGLKQQIRVLATYDDGEVRDVTREALRRERQHRGRLGQSSSGPDDLPPPGRGPFARPLRGSLRRDDPHRHGRPDRLRLGTAADLRQGRRAGRPLSGGG